MKPLFDEINHLLRQDKDVILVSVVASSGSVPRGEGARMVVADQGRTYGTIGGGEVEYRSEKIAIELLKEKRSAIKEFLLHPNDVADLGMVCGGDVIVYFNYLPSSNTQVMNLIEDIHSVYESEVPAYLITNISQNQIPKVYRQEKMPSAILEKMTKPNCLIVEDGDKLHIETLVYPTKVYIFGGGHVAQALVPVLSRVNFTCIILDDRQEFTRTSLFENLAKTKVIDFTDDGIYQEIKKEDFVCIMTRGHQDDYLVQKKVLKTDARYIGVIGSQRKVKAVSQKLINDGFKTQDLKRITTPIGLDINSETPEEIAISIAAEMIQIRNQ